MARKRRTDPPERVEQKAVAQYLDLRRWLWCHVPNGGARNAVTGAVMQGEGVKRGVPDVLVFETAWRNGVGYVGVAIEMKRAGGVLSDVKPEQRQWLAGLEARGWLTHVAFGASDAIAFLEGLEVARP